MGTLEISDALSEIDLSFLQWIILLGETSVAWCDMDKDNILYWFVQKWHGFHPSPKRDTLVVQSSFDSATAHVGLSSIHIGMLKFFGNMMNKDEQPRAASFKDHTAEPKDK